MNSSKVLVLAMALLTLGIIIFFTIRFIFYKLVDRRISNYQNLLISKYYNEVESIYKQMRGWRHDYHNHIQVMKAYLKLEKYEEMDQYLNELERDLANVDTILKTGNLMVDAILNSKLSMALSQSIRINAKATVPKNLNIAPVDLCVIIGNLMDNAIEAAMKLENPDERFIRVYKRNEGAAVHFYNQLCRRGN